MTPEDTERTQVVESLRRTLQPRSIAIVGLSDRSPFREYLAPNLNGDADLYFVHPNYDEVLGRPTYSTLTDIGQPLDVVLSMINAEQTVELVKEAASLGVGGLVAIAAGFAERDDAGAMLQEELRVAAQDGGLALVGPNGLGYINVRHRVSLTVAAAHRRRAGGVSIVSQSGAMLSGVSMAAWNYDGVGLNLLISAGNEAVNDLADYVDFLATDPHTTAIGLVVEKIRRPDAFFAAARRAAQAGKPIVALKLARSLRSRKIAASHTGALTGDARAYDVAFRQAGIALASDPEELVDRLALFDQLMPARWTAAKGVSIITMTGGFASLAVDLAKEEGLELPPMTDLESWLARTLPGTTVANPLDATGFGFSIWPEIVRRYAASDDADTILLTHPLDAEDESLTAPVVAELMRTAAEIDKAVVVANCSGTPAPFVAASGVTGTYALGRGLRPSLRGIQTMGSFVRYREKMVSTPPGVSATAVQCPKESIVAAQSGAMLTFAAAMQLLDEHGVPTAPYVLVPADANVRDARLDFDAPYVVKLGDVAHRTEIGGVRVGVSSGQLCDAVADMRAIAAQHQLPNLVVVQPLVQAVGEAFIGIDANKELGSMVLFGIGGTLVEVLDAVGGRMAPFDRAEAESLIDEFARFRILHGFRGQPSWDLDALADILVSVGQLAAASSHWMDSMDINPLLYGSDGFAVVDALCLVSPSEA